MKSISRNQFINKENRGARKIQSPFEKLGDKFTFDCSSYGRSDKPRFTANHTGLEETCEKSTFKEKGRSTVSWRDSVTDRWQEIIIDTKLENESMRSESGTLHQNFMRLCFPPSMISFCSASPLVDPNLSGRKFSTLHLVAACANLHPCSAHTKSNMINF